MPQYAVTFRHTRNHRPCVAILHDQTPKAAMLAVQVAFEGVREVEVVEVTDKHFVVYHDAEIVKRGPGNPEDVLRQRESTKSLGTPEK